jgi:2-succinyl-5-enolpyruvyl-6-hydroxy-3-cyclohexene-1-carboxylate synthase
VLSNVVEGAPDPATLFVSNSMPVRDLDRFGRPSTAALTVLGNRGASGIDGITSTALGAGSATAEPLVPVIPSMPLEPRFPTSPIYRSLHPRNQA